RYRNHVETVAIQKIRALPHHLMSQRGLNFDRLDGIELRFGPALVNLIRFAHHADGINLRGRRQGSDRDRHAIAAPFGIDHVLEYKCLALALIQTAKLPAHQGHELGVLVDFTLDTKQFAALFERFKVLTKVSVVLALARHVVLPVFTSCHLLSAPRSLSSRGRAIKHALTAKVDWIASNRPCIAPTGFATLELL